MSELFPGIPTFSPPVATPRHASAVILWREGAAGREVFWVRRGASLRFAGGFYAFPGGKVDAADARVPVDGALGNEAAQWVSAARELFEETGVLLATGAQRLSADERAEARLGVLEQRLLFNDFLASNGLSLESSIFTPAGRWVTPPFAPVRFDAHFFLAQLPEGQSAQVWPGELSDGEWIRCEDALAAWREGRVLLHPPSRWVMECLAAAAPPHCLPALLSPPHCVAHVSTRVDFQEHVCVVPLRTPTLPPATHTNTYVVGARELVLVDPGSGEPDELARLFAVLESFAQEGRRVTQLWLTHHHADHVGGLAACVERFGVPVLAHPETASRLGLPCVPVDEGALLLGRWRVLHTPGHARGHLCFFDENTRAALVGDLVSTVSTVVIDPPEGDMAEYLRQLARLRSLAPRTLYPAHGQPAVDAVGKLDEYLAHRAVREAKIVMALESEPFAPGVPGHSLQAVTALAYDDTPVFIHPLAARSCLAVLEKLTAEGRVRRESEHWMLSETGRG